MQGAAMSAPACRHDACESAKDDSASHRSAALALVSSAFHLLVWWQFLKSGRGWRLLGESELRAGTTFYPCRPNQ